MMRLLKFDNLITPSIIRGFFRIFVALDILVALIAIVGVMFTSEYLMTFGMKIVYIVLILVGLVVGIVFSRIGAELALVQFMIRDELAWQRVNRMAQTPAGLT